MQKERIGASVYNAIESNKLDEKHAVDIIIDLYSFLEQDELIYVFCLGILNFYRKLYLFL